MGTVSAPVEFAFDSIGYRCYRLHHHRHSLTPGAKNSMWKMRGKWPAVQDDGMAVSETLHFYLAPELALVSGDTIRNTGNPLLNTTGFSRRKHTIPCEP